MRGFALTVFGADALERVLPSKLAAKPGEVLVRHYATIEELVHADDPVRILFEQITEIQSKPRACCGISNATRRGT
jgi:hypothetical protein